MEERLIAIFRNNLGNRITAELSSGMLNEIIRIIKEEEKQKNFPHEVGVKIAE